MAFGFRAGSLGKKIRLKRLGTDIVTYNKSVKRKIDAGVKRSLIRQAAYAKGVARRMLVPAKEGETHSKVPRLHNGNFFKLSVQWGWDQFSWTSVAGPIQKTGRGVTRALEHGGTSTWIRKVHGKKYRGKQKVKAKPFMKKALKLTIANFPGQFRGAVRP